MQFLRLTLCIVAGVALSGGAAACLAGVISASPATSDQTQSTNASAVRSTFLARLQRLADGGRLFDPDATARIIDMRLQLSTKEETPPWLACGDGTMTRFRTTTVTASGPSWYHSLPSGAGHVEVPAVMINPATVSGDPEFHYRIVRSSFCAEQAVRSLQDRTEATAYFGGLPAFTCLTPSNIGSEIPAARYVVATDGVSMSVYQGRLGDDSGTTVIFLFRAGVPCALSAEVKQDEEDGLRYRRALYKYQICRWRSDQEFCTAHPDISWSDREMLSEMGKQALKECGTPNSRYLEEPASGLPPPPLPERLGHQSPCTGFPKY